MASSISIKNDKYPIQISKLISNKAPSTSGKVVIYGL